MNVSESLKILIKNMEIEAIIMAMALHPYLILEPMSKPMSITPIKWHFVPNTRVFGVFNGGIFIIGYFLLFYGLRKYRTVLPFLIFYGVLVTLNGTWGFVVNNKKIQQKCNEQKGIKEKVKLPFGRYFIFLR